MATTWPKSTSAASAPRSTLQPWQAFGRASIPSMPSPTRAQGSCGVCRPKTAMPPRFALMRMTTSWAINLSVWESLESLRQFVYKSHHVESLRNREQWFEPIEGPILALWWIPVGHIPTVLEARQRLEYLKEHGPTAHAFTFRSPFPPPGGQTGDVDRLDAAFCDWASHDHPNHTRSLGRD